MSDDQLEDPANTNVERLRAYLKDDTLAAKLVDTYRVTPRQDRARAIEVVAETRLQEIRSALADKESRDAQD